MCILNTVVILSLSLLGYQKVILNQYEGTGVFNTVGSLA